MEAASKASKRETAFKALQLTFKYAFSRRDTQNSLATLECEQSSWPLGATGR